MAGLPRNWDGYCGSPPNTGALLYVFGAVLLACPQAVPDLVPGGDGSVQAEWHLMGIEFEYCVEPDLTVSALLTDRSTGLDTEYFGDDATQALMAVAHLLGNTVSPGSACEAAPDVSDEVPGMPK